MFIMKTVAKVIVSTKHRNFFLFSDNFCVSGSILIGGKRSEEGPEKAHSV